jgi:hypothetical protein
MAYATIEEAWGLKSFARESSRPEKRVVIKTPPIKRPPVISPSAFASSTPHRPVPTVRDVQKFIAGLYAKSGASGVIQLLGPQISKALCGKAAANGKSWLSSLLEDPEKMLMILAVLFGVIVLLDVTKPVEPSLAPW